MGSSNESKVFLETTRTTSATMRMEHKTSFNDLPPLTHSQRTQTPSILQKNEETATDNQVIEKSEEKKHHEFTQTQTEANVNLPAASADVVNPIAFPFSDTVDAAAPITDIKKSAMEFFELNLKDLPPLQDEKYTRFEEVMKKEQKYVSKQNEFREKFQTQLVEDLSHYNLKPEPPPEMGFMPKVQQQQQSEKIVDKMKKLEESHKTCETPLSGTIQPPPTFMQKAPSPARKQPIAQTANLYSQNYQKIETSYENSVSFQKSSSPLPPSQFDVLRPMTPQQFRSASPKPSMEAVEMEKLWASKPKTPEPFVNHSFLHENKSSFVAYSSNQNTQTFAPSAAQQPVTKDENVSEVSTEQPKPSIKETKSFFEQRIKEEEVTSSSMDLKSPALVKQFTKAATPLMPPIGIEPGAPPEICYAPKLVFERTQSHVEKIEKILEQNLDKEPDRVPRGGVRIVPTRQTPQRGMAAASPQRVAASPQRAAASPQRVIEVVLSTQQVFSLPPKEDLVQPEPIVPTKIAQPYEPPKFETVKQEEKIESTKEFKTSGFRRVEPPKMEKLTKHIDEPMMPMPAPISFEPIKAYQPSFEHTSLISETKQTSSMQFSEVHQSTFPAPVSVQPAAAFPIPLPNPPVFQQPNVPPQQQTVFQQPQFTAPEPQNSQSKPFKPKPRYGEPGTYTEKTINLYKNFVKSEEQMHTSESYFQKIEKSHTESQHMSPVVQQVRNQSYPDVML